MKHIKSRLQLNNELMHVESEAKLLIQFFLKLEGIGDVVVHWASCNLMAITANVEYMES